MAEMKLRNRSGRPIKAGTHVKFATNSTNSIVPSDLSKAEIIGTVRTTVGNGSIAIVDILGGIASSNGSNTSSTISLRKTATHIEWRRGEEQWQTLIALTEIKGPAPIKGVDYFDGAAGTDGREVEIQTTQTHIQWRYVNGTWANLVPLIDIKGDPGAAGSDASVTKEAVESVLTGEIASHSHAGGSGGLTQSQILTRQL